MKRLNLLAVMLLMAACSTASGPAGPKANIAEPTLFIDQVVGPGELGYPETQYEVKYEVHITNHAADPITLKRITLRTANPPGGAYTLVPREYTFNIGIAPNEEKVVTVWAHATGYGVSMRDREPVTVKGVAYYETPKGVYNQIFNQEILQ